VIEDREMREVAPVKLGETFLERVKRFVRG
jgi:hypothetical protein